MTDYDHTPPPPRLRGSVMRSLRERDLIRLPTPWRVTRAAMLAAAATALFLLGARIGVRWDTGTGDTRPTFLLLLYGDSARAGGEGRVAEYATWAADLRDRGALVVGEKLADAGQRLEPGGGALPLYGSGPLPPTAATGLFIVRARDLAEALAIARECPHLRYGGRIEVRPIERT